MTTQTKIVLGILGAAAVGAVVGILMAPEKGATTRKNIADTAADWADKIGGVLDSGKDKLNKLKGEYKQKANSITSELS